tara:strand:+ start:437 stop:745 length:309 start_codon:yes stop_codon:yes gene_type:complete
MRALSSVACVATLTSACTFQGFIPSTKEQRKDVEAQIRRCAPSLQHGRWAYIEGNQQWEFGFALNRDEFHDPSLATCIKKISDRLSVEHSDIMIAYSAMQGA